MSERNPYECPGCHDEFSKPVPGVCRACEQTIQNVKALDGWRHAEPMIRQYTVGSRFGLVYCLLQQQGDHVAIRWGAFAFEAKHKMADWIRSGCPAENHDGLTDLTALPP